LVRVSSHSHIFQKRLTSVVAVGYTAQTLPRKPPALVLVRGLELKEGILISPSSSSEQRFALPSRGPAEAAGNAIPLGSKRLCGTSSFVLNKTLENPAWIQAGFRSHRRLEAYAA